MIGAQPGLSFYMFSQAKHTAIMIRLLMYCIVLSCVVTLTIKVLNAH